MDLKSIIAAGGIVMNKNNEVLLIHRRGKWDLPKGKLDCGETIEDTAVREVSEEVGIPIKKLKVKNYIGPTTHVFIKNNGWQTKLTEWFLMKTNYKGEIKVDQEEGIDNYKWMEHTQENIYSLPVAPRITYILNLIQNLRETKQI